MNTRYCSSCGNKNESLFEKPNFCVKCGQSLSVLGSIVNNKTDDIEDREFKFECEIEPAQSRKMSIKDLVSSPQAPMSKAEREMGRVKMTKKQVAERFRKTAERTVIEVND